MVCKFFYQRRQEFRCPWTQYDFFLVMTFMCERPMKLILLQNYGYGFIKTFI